MKSLDIGGPFIRRQHALLGHYLAIQAWLHRLDCIVLNRADLESFLELRRFKSSRIAWLQKDFIPWFPHQMPYYKTTSPSSIHSIFLSRVPISQHLPSGSMTTEQRIARMRRNAPRTAMFAEISSGKPLPTTEAVVSYLGLLSSGLANPRNTILLSIRKPRRRNPQPLQGSDTSDMLEAMTDALSDAFLGEVLSFPIRTRNHVLIPAKMRITKALLRQLAADFMWLKLPQGPFQRTFKDIRDHVLRRYGLIHE